MADEIYRQAFAVVGVANKDTSDSGIASSDVEKRKILSIEITTSGQVGNTIRLWIEREQVQEIYDYNIDTVEASGVNAYKSVNKINELIVNKEIPVGYTLKVSINCGATAKNIFGAYKYQIV